MSGLQKAKLVGGGLAVLVVLLVVVRPILSEEKEKQARDQAFEPVAASLQPLVDEYVAADLKSFPVVKDAALQGRKALLVDWDGKQLHPLQRSLDQRNLARAADQVGVVVYYRVVPDREPSATYEGGGKGFGATLVLVAVSHPERQIVGSLKKAFAAPRATVGVSVVGQSVSADIVAPIPPEAVAAFLDDLLH